MIWFTRSIRNSLVQLGLVWWGMLTGGMLAEAATPNGGTNLIEALSSSTVTGGDAKSTTDNPQARWPMPSGDAGSRNWVSNSLPDELTELWKQDTGEAIETTPVCDGEIVVVTDVMGGIEAIDLQTGKSLWRKELDTGFAASPALFSCDMLANKAGGIGEIPVLTAAKAPVPASVFEANVLEPYRSPLIVVGDVEGNVYAMNPSSGETEWKFTTEGEISSPASFFGWQAAAGPLDEEKQQSNAESGFIEIRVLVTSQDGSLYCLDVHTGKEIWRYESGDQIRCGPSIGNGKTFLGGCDGQLHVIDLATGKPAREPLPLGGPTGSTPALFDEHAIVPIMDGSVYSFNIDSGNIGWQYEDPERPQEYRGNAAVGPSRVIVASQNKNVDALDRETGKRLWRITLKRRADASPLITGDDVWIASTDGRLMRLSIEDGSERWLFETRGAFFASPAVVGNRMIVADDEGVVRCFGIAKASP